MTFVYEQPFWVGLLGCGLTLVLAGVWAQTALRAVGIAALVALALTAILVVVGVTVETDVEAVRKTIEATARDVESNDLNRVLARIHPQATEIRAQASEEFPKYRFDAVEIKHNLKVDVRDSTDGEKEALATFNVVVTGDLASGRFGEQSVPRFCQVTFRKDGDDWKIVDYSHEDALAGFRKRPEAE